MSLSVFKDRVAIITGASGGIGKELALQLADQGAWLVLAARRKEPLEELAELCRARGGRAIVVQMDLSEEAQCKELIKKTVEEYGRIDTLFNNAGITVWARFEDMQTLAPFEKVMQVNYLGSLYCTYYALPFLKESQGRITVVSSMAGKTGVPFRSGYSASKFALGGFFASLRIEMAQYGVSVTMVYPDYVQTGSRLQAFGVDGKQIERPLRKGKRIMTVEKCAQDILKATAKRKRELLMSFRGRIGMWVKMFAPGLVDKMANKISQ